MKTGRRAFAVLGLLALAVTAGCARETYRPKPLDPAGSAATLSARTLDAQPLRAYLQAQGEAVDPWPRHTWDLAGLARAAVFHHPDVAVARARASVAQAERETSATRLPISVTARPEFDSRGDGGTPWGLGLLVGLPIDLGGKREATTEQLRRVEESAALDVSVEAWRVRSRVRRHFVDVYVADRTLEALRREQAVRTALLSLLVRREAAGYASAATVSEQRLRVSEGELAIARAALRREQALGALAQAVAVPLEALRAVSLDFSAVADAAPPPAAGDVQRAALQNRIDLRRKLADYAAAEAAVRLEVARQYPDITLVPGYFWDADRSLWSIAFLGLVPPTARTRALIREAEARREVEARAFVAVQAAVIAEAQAASSRYAAAFEVYRAATRQIDAANAHRGQIDAQFARGLADRLALTEAALQAALAERGAVVAMLELQQSQAAIEDALQRPIDNLDGLAPARAAATSADTAVNPALIDND